MSTPSDSKSFDSDSPFDSSRHASRNQSEVGQFQGIVQRLYQKMQRDRLVQDTTDDIRSFLKVDRVVLYYFYVEWEGQVTFESLSDKKFSILGSTGPDECFNGEYATLYLEGRVRAISDIELEAIAPCHRNFLRDLQVQANLVVPILTGKGLWGLLVAHQCQGTKAWSAAEIEKMQQGASVLATASSIQAG
jgi:GAF domain-containing protein